MPDDAIPAGSVVLHELRIVEYLAPDGSLMWQDLSHSHGDDIEPGKAYELMERARAAQLLPIVFDMIHDFTCEECNEDGASDSS